MALKLMETLNAGPLFGVPRTGTLPAKHTVEVDYQAQLLKIPSDWQGVERIEHRAGETIVWEIGARRYTKTPSAWRISTQTSPTASNAC